MLERFTWYQQSAYRSRDEGLTVYIDPWGLSGEHRPADLVLITHYHSDHFSKAGDFRHPDRAFAPKGDGDLAKVVGPKTVVVAPADVAAELSGDVRPIAPGDRIEAAGVRIEAVPAYNTVEERLDAHPKDRRWVGYVLELGEHAYYHAGDTDHAPELDRVKADVAFLPVGGTYTMDATQAAGLAKAIRPALAVPMHYGFVVGTPADAERFQKEARPVEVRILRPANPFTQA